MRSKPPIIQTTTMPPEALLKEKDAEMEMLKSADEAMVPRLGIFRMYPSVKLPERAKNSDVGYDVFAHMLTETNKGIHRALHQRGVTQINTGLVVKPPPGYYVQVCSRSGWALQGVFVANAPGVIDPGYTGELMILLFNGSYETKIVSHGMRVAQIVLAPIVPSVLEELSEKPFNEERGDDGLGSSGV